MGTGNPAVPGAKNIRENKVLPNSRGISSLVGRWADNKSII